MALTHLKGWDPNLFLGSPWFFPLGPELRRFTRHTSFPSLAELRALLVTRCVEAGVAPVTPVYCPPKPNHRKKRKQPIELASLYDVRISEHDELPTREDDWHDFFNVLSFAAFPRTKRALHARQARLLRARIPEGARTLPGMRTREQDALTLLDEGGVIVAVAQAAQADLTGCRDDLTEALAACVRDDTACLLPFGHALFEHLIEGLPCPLAIPQLVVVEPKAWRAPGFRDVVDSGLCRLVSDSRAFLEPTSVKGLALERFSPA